MLISRMHWNFSVKSVAFIRLGSWEVSPTFLFQLPKGSIECFPWWTLMLIFYFVSKDNLNLKMVGKPPAICPTNWHLAFLLLSALDFLASLYLCSWGEKRERISWLQECQQTSWTWLALRDRPKESCCNSPELPRYSISISQHRKLDILSWWIASIFLFFYTLSFQFYSFVFYFILPFY